MPRFVTLAPSINVMTYLLTYLLVRHLAVHFLTAVYDGEVAPYIIIIIIIYSCYFECIVVTLKLRKEYLNSVTYYTPLLLRVKY